MLLKAPISRRPCCPITIITDGRVRNVCWRHWMGDVALIRCRLGNRDPGRRLLRRCTCGGPLCRLLVRAFVAGRKRLRPAWLMTVCVFSAFNSKGEDRRSNWHAAGNRKASRRVRVPGAAR